MKMMERVPPAVVQFFCNSHPVVYVVVYGERSGEYIASRSPVNSRTRQLAAAARNSRVERSWRTAAELRLYTGASFD